MLASSSPDALGRVDAIAIKTSRHAVLSPCDSVHAIAGVGLSGDVHADALSPRQLLLASSSAYADLSLPPHALQENLLLSVDTSVLRSGQVLAIGEQVLLWLLFQCEACGSLNAHAPALSRSIGMRRGMLARVLRGGVIRDGDLVQSVTSHMPTWSDHWQQRVLLVLDAIPAGSVLDYPRLAFLAGVDTSYCRAFPRLIKTLGAPYADKAVSVRDTSGRPRWTGAGLFPA